MKLYQKIGLGIAGLALATASYFSCIKQPSIKPDVQEISQPQTLESKLQNPKQKSYNFKKEQKDALGYAVKLMLYKGQEKQDSQEPVMIAPSGASLDEVRKAAAENCNGNCLIYLDGDGNYRLADGAGSIYFDDECFGNFKGPGWLFYDQYSDISYGTNKSDASNKNAAELIEWNKCD